MPNMKAHGLMDFRMVMDRKLMLMQVRMTRPVLSFLLDIVIRKVMILEAIIFWDFI